MQMCSDGANGYYVADYANFIVRRVFANGTVIIAAGQRAAGFRVTGGPATATGAAGGEEKLYVAAAGVPVNKVDLSCCSENVLSVLGGFGWARWFLRI